MVPVHLNPAWVDFWQALWNQVFQAFHNRVLHSPHIIRSINALEVLLGHGWVNDSIVWRFVCLYINCSGWRFVVWLFFCDVLL